MARVACTLQKFGTEGAKNNHNRLANELGFAGDLRRTVYIQGLIGGHSGQGHSLIVSAIQKSHKNSVVENMTPNQNNCLEGEEIYDIQPI